MIGTDEDAIDELGPVDYLVVEFPAGEQRFTGEMADELLRLADSGIVRILDLLVIAKDEAGEISAYEIDEVTDRDDVRALESEVAEILAADDVLDLAHAMLPGTVAGVIVWENTWAAPFAGAARRAGGQLVASGRIPIQAIAASMEAELASLGAGGD
jgi:hypothetical protein